MTVVYNARSDIQPFTVFKHIVPPISATNEDDDSELDVEEECEPTQERGIQYSQRAFMDNEPYGNPNWSQRLNAVIKKKREKIGLKPQKIPKPPKTYITHGNKREKGK